MTYILSFFQFLVAAIVSKRAKEASAAPGAKDVYRTDVYQTMDIYASTATVMTDIYRGLCCRYHYIFDLKKWANLS